MEDIKVTVRLFEHDMSEYNDWKVSRPRADRKIQEYVYHIDVEKNWLNFYEFLKWDFDGEKDWESLIWLKDFFGLMNMIFMCLAAIIILIVLLRRFFKVMKKEIKYT